MGGLGVAVLLRYTLRLLTLDQLGRAATLICALEQLRQANPPSWASTASYASGWDAPPPPTPWAVAQISEYRNSTDKNAPSPCPLTHCPWCRTPLDKSSFNLWPNRTNPERVIVGCSNFRCELAAAKNPLGLPVLFVDEQIYRERPCFVVATVDKFALLPWRGEAGMLFGKVHSMKAGRFEGPADGLTPRADYEPCPGLRPPELIVQDELHRSRAVGTLVGLYETALSCVPTKPTIRPDRAFETRVGPKILASTATVTRAHEQVDALFGRQMTLFPPPGIDPFESFFARVDDRTDGRLYLGVAAQGRPLKAILLRVYTALMAAAQHQKRVDRGNGAGINPGDDPADPYLTLVATSTACASWAGCAAWSRMRCAHAPRRWTSAVPSITRGRIRGFAVGRSTASRSS
jgi:hypothetical protein